MTLAFCDTDIVMTKDLMEEIAAGSDINIIRQFDTISVFEYIIKATVQR